jgi:hypothetical protein
MPPTTYARNMRTTRMIILFCIIAIFSCGAHRVARAQTRLERYAPRALPIALEVSPQYPLPGDAVVFRLNTYGVDTRGSIISWSIDGKVVPGSAGTPEFTTTLPASGAPQSVQVTITLKGQGAVVRKATVGGTSVDIIAEPQTTLPEGYVGGAHASRDALIRLVAVPDIRVGGVRVQPQNLVYSWKMNGARIPQGEGTGVDVVTASVPAYESPQVEVLVTTRDGTKSARVTKNIPLVQPKMMLYEESTLYGIRLFNPKPPHTANDTLSLTATPLFFPRHLIGQLRYSWRLDDMHATTSDANTKTFVVTRGNETTRTASIHYTLQGASAPILGSTNTEVTFSNTTFTNATF